MQLTLMSLEMGLIYAVVAMGIYLTLRALDFADLTCDGSFTLGAIVCAALIKADCSPTLALLAAMASGGLAGAATALLHLKCKVSGLLAGILVAFMLYSVNLRAAGGTPNITLLTQRTLFSEGSTLATLAAIAAIIWLMGSFVLTTDWGLGLRSVGQNPALARSAGVNVAAMTLVGLVASNAVIGLGGALFAQYTGFADIGQGAGTLIIGLASVMVGEKLLPSRNLWAALGSCALGSIAYRMAVALALSSDWLGLQSQDLSLITGLMVIAVMGIGRIQSFKKRTLCSL